MQRIFGLSGIIIVILLANFVLSKSMGQDNEGQNPSDHSLTGYLTEKAGEVEEGIGQSLNKGKEQTMKDLDEDQEIVKMKRSAEDVPDKMGDIKDDAEETVGLKEKGTWEKVKDKGEEVKDKIGEGFEAGKDKIGEGFEAGKDKITGNVEKGAEEVDQGLEKGKEEAEDLAD